MAIKGSGVAAFLAAGKLSRYWLGISYDLYVIFGRAKAQRRDGLRNSNWLASRHTHRLTEVGWMLNCVIETNIYVGRFLGPGGRCYSMTKTRSTVQRMIYA